MASIVDCTRRHRVGPARAAAFGMVSAGTPLLVHHADPIAVAATWLALAALFASWTWSRSCARPRASTALFAAIAAAQLGTHVAYAFAASLHPEATAHVHHVATGAPADAGTWQMLAVHALAALLGTAILLLLDRHVAAAAARVVDRVLVVVARLLGRRRHAHATAARPAVGRSILDSIARRARLLARQHARRGPPRLVFELR